MQKKIAIIDHPYHKKTNSFGFLHNILLERNCNIDMFYDNRYGTGNINNLKPSNYAVLLFEQSVPHVFHPNTIWIPMYDNFGEFMQNPALLIKNFRHVKFICFSKTLFKFISSLGLRALQCQYYPQPMNKGQKFNNKNTVFYWHRNNTIIWEHVKILLSNIGIDKVFFKNHPDPNVAKCNITIADKAKYNIVEMTSFLSKITHEQIMDQCNIVIAPRKVEGIGHVLLDGLKRGCCVIAYNAPTMNEYIINKQNGILFDNIMPLNLDNMKNISLYATSSVQEGYLKWENSKENILNFILEN